ncbi:hypothetical protein ACLOJK_019700 [Asimina triloba]
MNGPTLRKSLLKCRNSFEAAALILLGTTDVHLPGSLLALEMDGVCLPLVLAVAI